MTASAEPPAPGVLSLPATRDVALRYGYTLDNLHRLAYIAVAFHKEGYGFGVVSFDDRLSIARSAIAEALRVIQAGMPGMWQISG